jgi:P2 family phage contractile tail tube protein
MEATLKWSYPDNETAKAMVNPMKSVDIMVRSSKAEWEDGSLTKEAPVVIYMKGLPTKHTSGTHKSKEDTEVEDTISVTYLKIEIDGEEIIELDVLNNIYKIGGEDQLAQRRENLGI